MGDEEKKAARKAKREARRAERKATIGQEWQDSGGTSGLVASLGGAAGGIAGSLSSGDAANAGQQVGAALGAIPVAGKYIQAAQAVGSVVGSAMGVDSAANLSSQDLKNLGVSKAASFGNGLAETFGLNAIAGKIGGTTSKFTVSDSVKKLGSAYNIGDLTSAENASGKGALFGKYKMENAIKEATMKQRTLERIASENQLAKQADSSYLHNQNQTLLSGHRPGLIANVEKGTKLKDAKVLIEKWKRTSSLQKYQLGGKMNLLPEGSLHAHKHHLEDINPKLEGKITSKGIPVVSLDEGGHVVQQFAEIEKQEIVFTKEVTNKIEEFYKQYRETKDDNIAIECGKFIANQILYNTDDPEKTIKNA